MNQNKCRLYKTWRLPADKGRSTVILNTNTYKEKANELLMYDKTYILKLRKIPQPNTELK